MDEDQQLVECGLDHLPDSWLSEVSDDDLITARDDARPRKGGVNLLEVGVSLPQQVGHQVVAGDANADLCCRRGRHDKSLIAWGKPGIHEDRKPAVYRRYRD